MEAGLTTGLPAPPILGRAARLDDAAGRYIEAAKASFPRGLRLDGLRIVIDCANGAAYRVAPRCCGSWAPPSSRLASRRTVSTSKGCGSTVPEFLCAQVVEHGARSGHRAGWRRRSGADR